MEKKLRVEGMTCQHCVKRIKRIIEKYENVSDIIINLDKKEVAFSYDPLQTDIEAIVKTINNFGFFATEKT